MVQALIRQSACIDDLKKRAKRRIPRFAMEYLQGGCNQETALRRNRAALDVLCLRPDYLSDFQLPDLNTEVFAQSYQLPFGIAPLGLTGLIWPQASLMHAKAAKENNIPFVLSTVSTVSIEAAATVAEENLWFQLYPPADLRIREDLLRRLEAVGCQHLVVTVDVPAAGIRPKDTKNGLSVPPKISIANIIQSARCPAWSINTLKHGLPQFASLQRYMPPQAKMQDQANFIRHHLRKPVDQLLLQQLRDRWQGKLIVKGINHVDDAKRAQALGADGIIVSNHGGRQLDAAQPVIEVLPQIVSAVSNQLVVMADSGVESGVDIARFLSCGAQMVFVGRAFLYAVAAHAEQGTQHAIDLLQQELSQVMQQLHCASPKALQQHRLMPS